MSWTFFTRSGEIKRSDRPSPEIAQEVNGASVTFSGLDGNTARAYEITVNGTIFPNAASDTALRLQPQGDTGGRYAGPVHRHYLESSGSFFHDVVNMTSEGGGTGTNGILIATNNWGLNSEIAARGIFHAQGISGNAGRAYYGDYVGRPRTETDARIMRGAVAGYWHAHSGSFFPQTGSITSLTFRMAGAGGFVGRIAIRPVVVAG